ncbi:MAG: hydantoinase/oxoprolinase family protein, partial [Nitrospinota bacterium]|nr:hydantoinase/oxoprolinase family protein [Nitrospinota bacterium]
KRFKRGSGFPLRVPAIELIEIGAGGGSIARLDELGLLKVGPDSAGADPGPACYRQGGTLPTVTDANLVLGYLNPDYFLGGDMALDENASRRAINEHCAVSLGVTLEEAAAGICDLVSENMTDAARVHIAEQGEDPRRFSLMAFGGAGPLHAYSVAVKLGIRELICPAGAGVISSLGQLTAPMAFDLVRTHYGSLDELDWKRLRKSQADLSKEAKSYLKLAGVPEKKIVLAYSADMRYAGQCYEIRVPLPSSALGAKGIPAIRRAFWREYQKLYGRSVDNVTLEMVNLRLSARGPRPSLRFHWQHTDGAHEEGKTGLTGKRRIYLKEAGGYCNAAV